MLHLISLYIVLLYIWVYMGIYGIPYHVEVSIPTEVELTLHHVKKNGNCCFPQLRLWDQGHLQDWPHHGWDEFYFVGTCKKFRVKYIQWQDLDFPMFKHIIHTTTTLLRMWILCGCYLRITRLQLQNSVKAQGNN